MQISYNDKSTPKDGPSAGAATAILLFSLVEDFDIDQTGVITGDITVDGKLQPIGGVFAKITGAIAARAKFMVLPKDNERDVQEYFVLHPRTAAQQIQLFTAADIEEALTLMKNGAAADRLKSPLNISAKILRGEVTVPKTMSLSNSLDEIFSAAAPLLPKLASQWTGTRTIYIYPPKITDECSRRLNALNFKVAKEVARLQDAFLSYLMEIKSIAETGTLGDYQGHSTNNQIAKNRIEAALRQRDIIYEELAALSYNKENLEKLSRK
ncbi:MAG: hypothetical protein LBK71_09970 [Verrucomicrobiales bacterium]|nr:hypothetical protein [Verrucomicrobiales bacterium]